jgi:endonuclease G
VKNIFLLVLLVFFGCSSNSSESLHNSYDIQNSNELAFDLDSFICDQQLFKETDMSTITICYDYDKKAPLYVSYSLDKNFIDNLNIKDRPYFYKEHDLPAEYANDYNDFKNTGYDRGHLAPDADFDYNEQDLKQTYSMANIIAQDPYVNRELWVMAEERERTLTRLYNNVSVINLVSYSDKKTNTGITIPSGFYKIIYTKDIEECYFFENKKVVKNNLETFKVSCDSIFK